MCGLYRCFQPTRTLNCSELAQNVAVVAMVCLRSLGALECLCIGSLWPYSMLGQGVLCGFTLISPPYTVEYLSTIGLTEKLILCSFQVGHSELACGSSVSVISCLLFGSQLMFGLVSFRARRRSILPSWSHYQQANKNSSLLVFANKARNPICLKKFYPK